MRLNGKDTLIFKFKIILSSSSKKIKIFLYYVNYKYNYISTQKLKFHCLYTLRSVIFINIFCITSNKIVHLHFDW